MVPKVVLMRSCLLSLTIARPVTTAQPRTTVNSGNPHQDLQEKGVIDSGCSRHMTWNMSYLTDFEEIDGGYVAFRGNPKGRKITGRSTIKTDHLGKFDGKANEGFFVRYSIKSKAFRVFNSRTRIVEENLHVQFSKNTPNIIESRPNWLFDIDALTNSMNYKLIVAGNQSNGNAGTKPCDDAGKARMETISLDAGFKPLGDDEKKVTEEPGKEGGDPSKEGERDDQEKDADVNSTNSVYTISSPINTVGSSFFNANGSTFVNADDLPDDPNMPPLEDIVYSDDDEDVGAEADMNNLDAFMPASPIPTKDLVQQRTNHKDFQNCLFACFLSQEEPKKVIYALKDPSWIEAMQEELLQFKLQEVWTLVELPNGKRAIGTKWVYRNKKDERGIVIMNKARIEAIMLFLAYASFKDFLVYQMDIKSAFLYGKIEEEVYVCQPPGFEDLDFPDRVYKVKKTLYRLHQAPRAWLQVKQKEDVIFISQDKSMIGLLMYLTSSRPDIMFAVCAYARYQVNPKVSRLHAMKRIFRYLKGQTKLGLWYPKDYLFDLVAYTNSDYVGASLDRKSTIRDLLTKAFDATVKAKTVNEEVQLQALVDGKKIIIIESTVRRDLQLEDVKDEAVYKERDDRLVRAATTASSLEAEQDSDNIDKTRSKATLNEPSSSGTSSCSGPKCQETMGDTVAQTRFENVSKLSNDPLLARANEIPSLKRRVKKLKRRNKSRTHGLKRIYRIGSSRRVESSEDEGLDEEDASKQGRRINAVDADEDFTLVNVQDDADNEMFNVDTLTGDEVLAEQEVAAKDVNLSVDEVTLAQLVLPVTKVSIASALAKVSAATITTATIPTPRKGIAITDPGATTTTRTISSQQPSQAKVQDKGKGKMEEPEKPIKKKDQIRLGEELSFKLQAKEEEAILAREKAKKEQEANVALTEEWDDIQAKIEANHLLAKRLQAREQEELTIEERAKLF
ncbi:putative reverse transcriptase domain-containing protein [Tanacetum coccineum]